MTLQQYQPSFNDIDTRQHGHRTSIWWRCRIKTKKLKYEVTTIYYNYLSSISKKCYAVWHNRRRTHCNADEVTIDMKYKMKHFIAHMT